MKHEQAKQARGHDKSANPGNVTLTEQPSLLDLSQSFAWTDSATVQTARTHPLTTGLQQHRYSLHHIPIQVCRQKLVEFGWDAVRTRREVESHCAESVGNDVLVEVRVESAAVRVNCDASSSCATTGDNVLLSNQRGQCLVLEAPSRCSVAEVSGVSMGGPDNL